MSIFRAYPPERVRVPSKVSIPVELVSCTHEPGNQLRWVWRADNGDEWTETTDAQPGGPGKPHPWLDQLKLGLPANARVPTDPTEAVGARARVVMACGDAPEPDGDGVTPGRPFHIERVTHHRTKVRLPGKRV